MKLRLFCYYYLAKVVVDKCGYNIGITISRFRIIRRVHPGLISSESSGWEWDDILIVCGCT